MKSTTNSTWPQSNIKHAPQLQASLLKRLLKQMRHGSLLLLLLLLLLMLLLLLLLPQAKRVAQTRPKNSHPFEETLVQGLLS